MSTTNPQPGAGRQWPADAKDPNKPDDHGGGGGVDPAALKRGHEQDLFAVKPILSIPLAVTLFRLGGAVWVFTPGELYQSFQVELRKRFPGYALVITTMTNDWQPGYLPAANAFGYGIYQETIAGVGPGALEALTEAVSREIQALVAG